MQLLDVASPAPSSTASTELAAALVGCLGSHEFAGSALAVLNRLQPLGWWSVYRLSADPARAAPPMMHLAASHGVADGTAASWQAYRAGLYRRDETFEAARERLRPGRPVLTHWAAREIRGAHRARIYDRHGLRERVSVACGDDGAGLLAINFYRTEAQPAFADVDIDQVRQLAPLLLACVRRQLAWLPGTPASGAADDPLALLGGREREVCDRLLRGWTHDGIAADLGLSAATVRTYRDRAFERLGLRHRHELFALAAGTLG